jgi:RNA polymerase sigma factor (sigma-70 family)
MTESFELDGLDFSEQTRRVRALARSLVRDDATADDLAQQALALHAMHGGGGKVRDARAWLGAVVRNLAAQRHRGESRRRARERVVARPEATTTSTVDVVAQAELLERIVQAVLRLDEPYRSTVLLRYLQELPTEEVARRLEVEPATVRVRTKRALERLRESLRTELGAAFAVVLTDFGHGASTAIPSLPEEVTRAMEPRSFPTTSGSTVGSGAESAALVSIKSPLVAAAIVTVVGVASWAAVGGFGGSTQPPGTEDGARGGSVASARMSTNESDADRALAASASSTTRTSTVIPDAAVAIDPTPLEGIVLDADGRPVAGAVVRAADLALDTFTLGAQTPFRETRTDGNGAFAIPAWEPRQGGLLLVEAAGHGRWRGRPDDAPAARTIVQLPRATSLEGVVRDAETGTPRAGVTVYGPVLALDPRDATAPGQAVVRWRQVAVSDDQGRFHVADVPAGSTFALRLALPGHVPTAVELLCDDSGPQRREFALRSEQIDVLLRDHRTHEPIQGAVARSSGTGAEYGYSGADGIVSIAATELATGAGPNRTREVADELAFEHPRFARSTLVWMPGSVVERGRLLVPLLPAGRITGQVRTASGEAASGAVVRWFDTPRPRLYPASKASGLQIIGTEPTVLSARADEQGRFEIGGIPTPVGGEIKSGQYEGSLEAALGSERGIVQVDHNHFAHDPKPVELAMARWSRASGTVQLGEDAPPMRLFVSARAGGVERSTWTAPNGTWSLELPVVDDPWRVSVRTEGSGAELTATKIAVPAAGRHGVALSIPTNRLHTLTGTVVDSLGRPVRGADVRVRLVQAERVALDDVTEGEYALSDVTGEAEQVEILEEAEVVAQVSQRAEVSRIARVSQVRVGQEFEPDARSDGEIQASIEARIAEREARRVQRERIVLRDGPQVPATSQKRPSVAQTIVDGPRQTQDVEILDEVPVLVEGQWMALQNRTAVLARARTDTDGRFVLPVPDRDARYVVEVEGTGLTQNQWTGEELSAASGQAVRIEIPRTAEITVPLISGTKHLPSSLTALWQPHGGEPVRLDRAIVDRHVQFDLPVGATGTLKIGRHPLDEDGGLLQVDLTGPRPRVTPNAARF